MRDLVARDLPRTYQSYPSAQAATTGSRQLPPMANTLSTPVRSRDQPSHPGMADMYAKPRFLPTPARHTDSAIQVLWHHAVRPRSVVNAVAARPSKAAVLHFQMGGGRAGRGGAELLIGARLPTSLSMFFPTAQCCPAWESL